MVVAVVTPVVFVLRLLKNAIKTQKLNVCKQCLYLLLYIIKHIAIHVTLVIVPWLELKPLWSNRTPHIGYSQKAQNVTKMVASS